MRPSSIPLTAIPKNPALRCLDAVPNQGFCWESLIAYRNKDIADPPVMNKSGNSDVQPVLMEGKSGYFQATSSQQKPALR